MDKTAIKNYAVWARTKLIGDIKYKAGLLGITEKGIADPLPQSTAAEQFFAIGTREPYTISGAQLAQRQSLVTAIRQRAQAGDYLSAYNSIMEEVAYTWFNRFIAVRFMEVNDYLLSRLRVLSAADGRQEPDIVRDPFAARLDYTPAEVAVIGQYQQENAGDKLFNLLFIKVCNDLSRVLPQLFEAETDYTELLLNISYTDEDGLIYRLVHDIPENNFDVNAVDETGRPIGQVEIIGWLYQYYNTEPKNETYALLKKNVKVTKERIPSVTQLFTPDWIVRYMVENSLGRLWLQGHPSESLQNNWRYYLCEAQQEQDVRSELAKMQQACAALRPEDIRLIDPCMGSGHILVYAFDVLMQLYTQMGYTDKDAVISILENNLYGLDIDERAFQLAYFAVLMKARQYHRFILKKQPVCHIYAICESNGINMDQLAYFGAQLDDLARPVAQNMMQKLIAALHDAKEYGSIISVPALDWELLRQFAAEYRTEDEQNLFNVYGIEETQKRLQQLIAVGQLLAQKYQVVVTNPPYMGGGSMGEKLGKFVKQNYPDSKSDLFAVFMEVCHGMNQENGYQAMITQHAWMFLSSFEKLRAKMQKLDIVNMVHLGARAFEEIGGEVVQTTSFVLANKHTVGYKGTYCRLIEPSTQVGKEEMFLSKANRYSACSDNFAKIPGAPVAYWVNTNISKAFENNTKISDITFSDGQNKTGNNDLFIRSWWEVKKNDIGRDEHWVLCARGGGYRKWYGFIREVIDWSEKARMHYRKDHVARIVPKYIWYKEGITWSRITSGNRSFRLQSKDMLFEMSGLTLFVNDNDISKEYILGFLNTSVSEYFIKIVTQVMTLQIRDVQALPLIYDKDFNEKINVIVKDNVNFSRTDWDSFETSWDFATHPLVAGTQPSIAATYAAYKAAANARFDALRANEEELNKIFVNIYGLEDELTPDVEARDVTVHRVFDSRDDVPDDMRGSSYVLTQQDVVKGLISYAVGCMLGRYSTDVPGLVYAGGVWDESKYTAFKPDADNVIPITDEDYFEDDIVGRFIEWLKAVYGAQTLEENLRFIADALGSAGDTARQKIRSYFLKDFFKDHCKMYQKRPIYWLYDSGRQNGFKALIYMHRYNADTSGQVRAEYLASMETIYESEIVRMQDIADNGTGRSAALAAKRIEKLKKQLKECRDYDAVLGHIALARIGIDLDDGVKVNYDRVQTAKDGALLQVLAKI